MIIYYRYNSNKINDILELTRKIRILGNFVYELLLSTFEITDLVQGIKVKTTTTLPLPQVPTLFPEQINTHTSFSCLLYIFCNVQLA